jgi:hypothetical protein
VLVRRVALALGFLIVVGCDQPATPDVVFVNRSGRNVALAPGIIVQSCDSAAFSDAQLKAAGDEFLKRAMSGDLSWVPADALAFQGGLPGSPSGAQKPTTYILSGASQPQVVFGPVPDSELPSCGGEPIFDVPAALESTGEGGVATSPMTAPWTA